MPVEDAGVADVVGAASLLISEAALAQLIERAADGAAAVAEEVERLAMDASQVIIRPVVSEKSYVLAEIGKYTFRVHPNAHKTQIRQAIEQLFDVNVRDVRTVSVKSKPKRRGVYAGRTRTWKKAIVQVSPGDTIPIFQGLEGERVMPIRKPKPTSPGRRFVTYPDFAEITRSEPEKSLAEGLKKSGGRNARGRKTSRHRGGGAKRLYRKIDFKRRKDGVPAKVAHIEYDPNRSAYIALLHYVDGEKRYILAPQRLPVGMMVQQRAGRRDPRRQLPAAREHPGRHGGPQRRAHARPRRPAGALRGHGIQLLAKDGGMATLRLPSGEMRMVRAECRATVGTIGNADHQNVKIGKAGRKRHMGVRPQTRGTAMNPVDHPHGGGEGSTTPGRHPVTPWGVPTLGYRTRKKGKQSDRYIVRGRRRGKKR